MYTLEVCIDSCESAVNAAKGGATRLELCQNLVIGGTTPSIELFRLIKRTVSTPLNVLIRPRFGDFCYTDYEFEIMLNEISLFESEGANGVVYGVLKPDGSLDMARMERLTKAAKSMDTTLHRAFDMVSDPYKTLEDAQYLGIKSILTSGLKNNAVDAIDLLNELDQKATGIQIMAGSGVNYDVVKTFLEKTNIKSYHMSGKTIIQSAMSYRNSQVNMGIKGFSECEIWRTDEQVISKVSQLLGSM